MPGARPRTGRVDETGEAYTVVTDGDGQMVREIEGVLGARIERRTLPGFNYGNVGSQGQSPEKRQRRSQTRGQARTK